MSRFLPLVLLAALLVPGGAVAAPAGSVTLSSASSHLQLRSKDALVHVRARLANPSGVKRDARLKITFVARNGKRTLVMSRPVKDLPRGQTSLALKGALPDVVADRYDVEVCVSDAAGRDCRLAAKPLQVAGQKLKITTYGDFGYVKNGEQRYGGVSVTNEGVGAVSFTRPVLTGDEGFRTQKLPCDRALGHGDSCSVSLRFRATEVGSYSYDGGVGIKHWRGSAFAPVTAEIVAS